MKSKNISTQRSVGVGPFEIALLILPFLALTPNFFVPPDLSYQGLATQELVFAMVATIFAGIGLFQIIRSRTTSPRLNREYLLIFVALAALIIWQLVTLLWAPAPEEGLRVSGIWFGFGIFFGAGLLSLRPRSALWLHYSLTVVAVILAISLLYERAVYGYVMLGIFFNHGITSELLVTILPLQILNYLCSEKRGLTIVSAALSGLLMVTLLIGMRRGALIGMVVVLIAIALALGFKLVKLQSKQRLAIVMAVFVVAGIAVGVRFRQEIAFRIQGATQLQAAEGGLTTRLRGWITAWEMGSRNALVGVGNAGYPSLYGSYRRYFVSNPKYAEVAKLAGPEDNDEIHSPLTHNEYLQIFVELGVVGLAIFAACWVLIARRLWQGLRRTQSYWVLGAILGLAAFGISSATSAFSLRYTPGAFLLACVLAIGFAFTKPDEEGSSTSSSEIEDRSIALPRIAAIACSVILVLACLVFGGRASSVYSSQSLQGRAYLSAEPLDFAFYPNNPAGNERLRARYDQVIKLDPQNAGAHLGYGLLLYQMKNAAEAVPHIEYALKHGYSRPFTYVLLAFAYEQQSDLAKASKTLDDCVASFPLSLFSRAAYAEILRKEGKIDQMREQQDQMRKIDAPQAQSWELALKMKRDEAVAEAARRQIPEPDKLLPRFASMLVGMRAYHYLK